MSQPKILINLGVADDNSNTHSQWYFFAQSSSKVQANCKQENGHKPTTTHSGYLERKKYHRHENNLRRLELSKTQP